MNIVLLRMRRPEHDPADWREASLPNITSLQSLSSTIQKPFSLGSGGAFEYEVLGCRAPGYHARLRDLTASGVTRFRYLHTDTRKQQVEIVIAPPMPGIRLDPSTAGSREQRPRPAM